jgi:hypothetical protein
MLLPKWKHAARQSACDLEVHVAAQPELTISLTASEVLVLTLALTEYLYLVEEGNLVEAIEERGTVETLPALGASEVAELQARLESLL